MRIRVRVRTSRAIEEIDAGAFNPALHERMSKVRLRSDGSIIEIAEAEFNATLHDPIIAGGRSVGEMPAEEFLAGIGREFGTAIAGALAAAGAGTPNRGTLAVLPGGAGRPQPAALDGDPREVSRIERFRPSWEAHYDALPESERKHRSVEHDVLTWRWGKALLDGNREVAERMLRDKDPVYSRAVLAEGAVATGGALVPSPLASLILLKKDKRERIGPRAMRFTSEAQTIDVPGELVVGDVAQVAENALAVDSDSTFSLVQLIKRKTMRTCRSSRELLEDVSSAFDLSTILSNQAARRFAVAFDTQAAETGDGIAPNHTLSLANAVLPTVAGTGGAATRGKVMALLLGLPSEWRDGGDIVFMGNSAVTTFLSLITDLNGRPIYLNQNEPARPLGDVGNAVGTVEGRPYIEVPRTANILMVGSLAEGFAVLDDNGILVETSTETGDTFNRHQIAWKFLMRRDSAVIRTDCFVETDAVVLTP